MYVAYWHLADNPTAPAFVRYWGKADIGPDQRLTPVGCHFHSPPGCKVLGFKLHTRCVFRGT